MTAYLELLRIGEGQDIYFCLQKSNSTFLHSKIQNGAMRSFSCPISTDKHRLIPVQIQIPSQQVYL